MLKREFTSGAKLLLVDDLRPEDIAMIQALYSRSAESAEKHINTIYAARREAVIDVLHGMKMARESYGRLSDDDSTTYDSVIDDLMTLMSGGGASAKAAAFASRFYVGYNHKSIGDGASTTLFIENVSLLAAKAIQDNPLYNGQETSTRFINMAAQRIVDPVGTLASKAIHDRWMAFYTSAQGPTAAEVQKRYPRQEGEAEAAYVGAVTARVFDILRAFLPAGICTQLSWHTNLRQAGDNLTRLHNHPAAEMRVIGQSLSAMLREQYPSSGSFGGDDRQRLRLR